MLLELAGFGDDDPYFAFLNAARVEIPVFWGDVAVAWTADGGSEAEESYAVYGLAAKAELSEAQQEMLRKMACWGYYRMTEGS